MKLRTLVIAVAALAALCLVAYFANRPDAPAPSDPRVGKPLLGSEEAAKAAAVVISDKGKKVELRRDASGAWQVASYFGLAADFDKLSRLVQDLHEAKVDRFVTSNPDRIAGLEFADTSISLADASGREIWSVTFGRNADNGNGRFLRFGNEAASFYSTLHVWFDTDAKGWADPRLTDLKTDEIAKVEIGFETGEPVVATRAKKDAPWEAKAAAGQKLDTDKVGSVVVSLAALRFSETTPADDPQAAEASRHARTLRLTTFAGKTVTITLSRKPEEKHPKPAQPAPAPKPGEKADSKPAEQEFETIPAGPVYILVSASDPGAPVNEAMKRRRFQVDEFTYTSLPQKPDELFKPDKAK